MSTTTNPRSIVLIDSVGDEFTIDVGDGLGSNAYLREVMELTTTAEIKVRVGEERAGFVLEVLEEIYET